MLHLVLCLASFQAEAKDPAAELAAVSKKFLNAGSYSFEATSESSGPAGPGGLGGGADESAGAQPATLGKYQKDKPVYLERGNIKAWREDRVMVTETPDGQWKAFDPQSAVRGRRERAEGEPRPPREEGQAATRVGGSTRAMVGLMTMPAPHQMLQGVGEKVAELQKSEQGGKFVFSGKLSPEAAQNFSGARFLGGRGEDLAGRAAMQHSGTFSITVDPSGVVQSIVVETVTSGSFGERSFEQKRKTTYKLSAIGSTELEVPEAALAALKAGPPPASGEEFF